MPDTTPPSSDTADANPYEGTRRSTSASRYAALGRGGAGSSSSPSVAPTLPSLFPIQTSKSGRAQLTFAGNISAAPPRPVTPTDLETPTLKEDVYTTGRGGSGNMVANTGKAGARIAQDVVAYVLTSFLCVFVLRAAASGGVMGRW